MSPGIPGRTIGVVNSDIARLQRDNDRQERTAAMLANAAPERSGRLSKSHLKYPYTYYTFDEALPGRVPSSSGLRSPAMPLVFGFLACSTSLHPCRAGRTTSSTPRPRKAPNLVARKRQFVEQFPADLGHPVSREEIFRFHPTQISGYFRAVPSRQEGRIARRHERGTGCGGRESAGVQM
jgi:hypothetical protein